LAFARTDVGGLYMLNARDDDRKGKGWWRCKKANSPRFGFEGEWWRDGKGRSCRADDWIPLTDFLGRNDNNGVLSVAVDPRDAGRIFFTTGQYVESWAPDAVLVYTEDGGESWSRTALPFKLGGNQDGRSAGERLQVDPNAGHILLLGTNDAGLWASADSAANWARVESFPEASLTFVLFDERSGEENTPTPVIYAGVNTLTAENLYRSLDGGVTWTAVPGQPVGLIPNHARLDNDGVLYISYANHLGPNNMTDGAVWKLDAAGDSWTDITPLVPGTNPGDTFGYGGLSVDRNNPGVIVVTTIDRWNYRDEIFRSLDGGETWFELRPFNEWQSDSPWIFWHESPEDYFPHWMGDIEIDPHNPERAMFVTGGGIWMTRDITAADPRECHRGGHHKKDRHWKEHRKDCHRKHHGKQDRQKIVWEFFNRGLEETVPLGLISPPEGRAPLLSALGDIGGFYHQDLDRYPRDRHFFDPVGSTNTWIDFAELNPSKVVRSNWGDARGNLSQDGGRTWTDLPGAPTEALSAGPGAIALSADGARLLWIPKTGVPYYSTDDGASWQPSSGAPADPNSYLTMYPTADRVNPEKFYIYDPVGATLHVSNDGGETFTRTASGLSGFAGGILRAVPGREGHLWLPRAWDGLYRSTDSGATLTRVSSVQEGYQIGFGAAAPQADYPAIYLWGRVKGTTGVFRSDDEGETWVRINDDDHQYGWINLLIGDPRTYGRVYIGTAGRGIVYGDIDGDITPPPPPPPVVDTFIYTDSMASGWVDWYSWTNFRDMANSDPVHGGPASIAVTYGQWQNLRLDKILPDFSGPELFDVNEYQNFAFWIYGGGSAPQSLLVSAVQEHTWVGAPFAVTAEPGQWQQVVIPISSLGLADPMISGFAIYDPGNPEGAGTVYIDDVSLQQLSGP
jgi:photosystem II stability/assembly factor-like uncharacterized protein